MRYTSTRNPTLNVSFEEALTSGYAPDGGLFVPRGDLPQLDGRLLRSWQTLTYAMLLQAVLRLFIDMEEVSDEELKLICQESLQGFRDSDHAVVPLVAVTSTCLTIAELFHGPTYCFKDLGMRAVLRLLELFGRHRRRCITLLVSTTGDTGPAAARAVADMGKTTTNVNAKDDDDDGCWLKLAVHYPHGQISDFQRRQMTCLKSPNIQVIAFEGGGDDMDVPIKSFLQHRDQNVVRTGVNSYNIVRTVKAYA
jgi:threonine synthase